MGRLLDFEYFCGSELCTRVHVDYNKGTVEVENFTDDLVNQAFGKQKVSIESIDEFFRDRVIPETRVDIKEVLEELGMTVFDAEAIARISNGTLTCDNNWIRFDKSNITWEEIKEKYPHLKRYT